MDIRAQVFSAIENLPESMSSEAEDLLVQYVIIHNPILVNISPRLILGHVHTWQKSHLVPKLKLNVPYIIQFDNLQQLCETIKTFERLAKVEGISLSDIYFMDRYSIGMMKQVKENETPTLRMSIRVSPNPAT